MFRFVGTSTWHADKCMVTFLEIIASHNPLIKSWVNIMSARVPTSDEEWICISQILRSRVLRNKFIDEYMMNTFGDFIMRLNRFVMLIAVKVISIRYFSYKFQNVDNAMRFKNYVYEYFYCHNPNSYKGQYEAFLFIIVSISYCEQNYFFYFN